MCKSSLWRSGLGAARAARMASPFALPRSITLLAMTRDVFRGESRRRPAGLCRRLNDSFPASAADLRGWKGIFPAYTPWWGTGDSWISVCIPSCPSARIPSQISHSWAVQTTVSRPNSARSVNLRGLSIRPSMPLQREPLANTWSCCLQPLASTRAAKGMAQFQRAQRPALFSPW